MGPGTGCHVPPACPNRSKIPRENRADVIVVGTGASGCFAALYAQRSGAKVIMLESESTLGVQLQYPELQHGFLILLR